MVTSSSTQNVNIFLVPIMEACVPIPNSISKSILGNEKFLNEMNGPDKIKFSLQKWNVPSLLLLSWEKTCGANCGCSPFDDRTGEWGGTGGCWLLLLRLFACHLVDLGGTVRVGDGGGQLDVLPTAGSGISGDALAAGLLISVALV